jgi:hypothetical protein
MLAKVRKRIHVDSRVENSQRAGPRMPHIKRFLTTLLCPTAWGTYW